MATGATRRLSDRSEKAIRLAGFGALATPFGMVAIFTDNEVLAYVTIGIVLTSILLGPVIERWRARS